MQIICANRYWCRLPYLKATKYGPLLAGIVALLVLQTSQALELTAYQGSKLVSSSQGSGDYNLALGPMENINGQWQAETQLFVTGQWQRAVYELPKNRPLAGVLANYQAQLQQVGARPLFVCAGLTCGSSGTWANQHFGERQLYGLDQHQFYLAYQLSDADVSRVLVFYLVTRGNQRSYLLIEQIQTQELIRQVPSDSTLKALLEQGQPLVLPLSLNGTQWQIDIDYQRALQRILHNSPALKLALVVADYRDQSLEKNLRQSGEVARSLAGQLALEPVTGRVRAQGIGNLAANPATQALSAWVLRWR